LLAVNAVALGLYAFSRLDRPVAESFGPAGEAVYNLLNPYERPTRQLSAAARRFERHVMALGGTANVLVDKRGFLGVFGRSELFNASFRKRAFDDDALGRFAALYGDRMDGLELRASTGLTDAGLKHLKRMPRLRRLQIHYIPRRVWRGAPAPPPPPAITGAGLVHLKGLTQLRSLTLTGLPLTDGSLEAINDLPALTGLHLGGTRIQGTSLARLKSLSQLSSLSLVQSPITEDGLRALSGATNLRYLSLLGVPLTADALPLLKAIPRLEHLDIAGCGFLDEEVLDLAKSRPGLRVDR
jgi:hypothetical protein